MRDRLVFISHSSRDTWVAKQIARVVSDCGATSFLDEAEIDVGADFEEEILSFLERAHELLVLLTPWALERPYIWAELGAAWAKRIPIVALLHGITAAELQSKPGVPVFLKKRDLLNLNDIDKYLEQLRARVQGGIMEGAYPQMSKPTVFISYSFSDRSWVRDFAKSLQERGLGVWLDQYNIRAGESVREALEKGLRESSMLALLVTLDTIQRPSLFFEIGAAIGMGKPVVPIIAPDVDPAALPQSLRVRRYLMKASPQATAEQFVLETAESQQPS